MLKTVVFTRRKFLNRVYFAACLALLLLTAGCFRPAGESIEPTSGVVLPSELSTVQPTPMDSFEETEEALFFTPIAPTINLNLPEDEPTSALEITLDLGAIQAVATQQPVSLPTLVPATVTPQFITPGSPLGPVTPDTATPTSDMPSTSTPSGLITPTALPGTEDSDCIYIVQPGDNLYRIATARGITVDDMRNANPNLVGDPPILQVGQSLQLPDCDANTAQTSPQATVPSVITDAPPAPAGGQVYTIQPGDTLYAIALRNGVTVQAIIDANNFPNPDRLDVGQQIVIPSP
jgi:LysM repeat protein